MSVFPFDPLVLPTSRAWIAAAMGISQSVDCGVPQFHYIYAYIRIHVRRCKIALNVVTVQRQPWTVYHKVVSFNSVNVEYTLRTLANNHFTAFAFAVVIIMYISGIHDSYLFFSCILHVYVYIIKLLGVDISFDKTPRLKRILCNKISYRPMKKGPLRG